MSIEVPIILISLAGMVFWTLVGFAMGHKQGVADESLRQRKARKVGV